MTVASVLRGLAQVDLATFAPEDPDDPFAAAYPTFGRFTPPGATTPRDELVLLRRSVATVPTARLLGSMPGGLSAFDENDVPAVFRALNPANNPSDRGFPTFTYGRTQNKEYMNVVRLLRGAFKIEVAPVTTPAMGDPTMVVAMFAGSHFFARSKGFKAGFPTFNLVPIPGSGALGNEIVVFPGDAAGVVVSSEIPPADVPSSWTFESVPIINDLQAWTDLDINSGLALATTAHRRPLFFNVLNGALVQYTHTPPQTMYNAVDPDVTGVSRGPGPIVSQVSALADKNDVHILYGHKALIHATRPQGLPDSFTWTTVSGRIAPEPTGSVGESNHLIVGPTGDLHALAYLTSPPGEPMDPEYRTKYKNLLHLSFDGTSWTQDVVDGDGGVMGGQLHLTEDCGAHSSAAFDSWGRLNAFYLMRLERGGTRLRHAVLTDPGWWFASTLDGGGGSQPPTTPGTGPTTATVGTNPTAVWFEDSLWCIYDDLTWGNLRCARQRWPTNGTAPKPWEYHTVDGTGRLGGTRNVVQSAIAVVWEDTLSLFYADQSRNVIRHAYRREGATRWTYEVLDGNGGPDGRVDKPCLAPIAAVAAGPTAHGKPSRPLMVAYCWKSEDTPTWSNVRLAIYG